MAETRRGLGALSGSRLRQEKSVRHLEFGHLGISIMRMEEIVPLHPYLDEVFISNDGTSSELLREGKWVSGRFDRNIRIDQPTHLLGNGKVHGHIYGRRGDELGVVNVDGSPSHGTKMKLHDRDADALRAHGFVIPLDNIVEWFALPTDRNATFLAD